MQIFCSVSGLSNLECANLWDDARKLLYDKWSKHKDNLDYLCRIMSECWFFLSQPVNCSTHPNDTNLQFKKTLSEVTEYGMSQFADNPKFLWLAGYMIQMFPSHFCLKGNSGEFLEWEQRGENMLYRATQLEPSNLIAQTLYWGTKSSSPLYSSFQLLLVPRLNELFPGQTAIEEYFREILGHTGDGGVC